MQILNNLGNMIYDLRFVIAYGSVIIVTVILFTGCLLKKKIAGSIAAAAVLSLTAAGGILYCIPHTVIDADIEDVYRIEISDVTVTDRKAIEEILNDLNGSLYKRMLPSGIGGYEECSVRGFDRDGNLLFCLGISDGQTVDTGLFWEKRVNGEFHFLAEYTYHDVQK